MGFNPLQLLQVMRSSNNPMGVLNQLMGSNPEIGQAMRLIYGKNSNQLKQTAMNMARERGVNLEQLASEMGLRLPK